MAREISVMSQKLARQNFGLAILYNVFAVPVAMAGLASPFLAAVAMSTSSVIVIANALRLSIAYRARGPVNGMLKAEVATRGPAAAMEKAA
jgi:cation transport ATPase